MNLLVSTSSELIILPFLVQGSFLVTGAVSIGVDVVIIFELWVYVGVVLHVLVKSGLSLVLIAVTVVLILEISVYVDFVLVLI